MMPRHKRQDAAFALDLQMARVRHHFNGVNVPAREPIDGIEHLQRSHQIELVDGRHDDDDNPAAGQPSMWPDGFCCVRHGSFHYASGTKPAQAAPAEWRISTEFCRIRTVALRYAARSWKSFEPCAGMSALECARCGRRRRSRSAPLPLSP